MNYQEFYNKLTLVNKLQLLFVLFLLSYGIGRIISDQNILMGIAMFLIGLFYLYLIIRNVDYLDNVKEEINFSGNDLSNESK